MNDGMAMDSPLAGTARAEKALWYQEVLSLDPDSRIFLPYARLLAELGRSGEAVDILKSGLTRHPEFLEARLFLIELLHASGQAAAAGFEADGIIQLLSQSSALWKIWSRKPGLRADQAAMLLYFSSSLHTGGLSLAEVFEAGITALSGKEASTPKASDNGIAPEPVLPQPEDPAQPQPDEPAPAPAEDVPQRAFTMDDNAEWYSLDAVPDDDSIYDDEDDAPAAPPVQALHFVEAAAAASPASTPASLPEQDDIERIPVMAPVPRGTLEAKSSLCTRSMARVLEEQGATDEAADIYRELLEQCSSPEEKAELNAKLASLIQDADSAPAQSSASGVFELLETLADRLENRSRA